MPVAEMLAKRPKAIFLSGGPASVYEPGAPAVPDGLFEAGVPTLGICYGFQAMARALGGRGTDSDVAEYGRTPLTVVAEGGLLGGLPPREPGGGAHRGAGEGAPRGVA